MRDVLTFGLKVSRCLGSGLGLLRTTVGFRGGSWPKAVGHRQPSGDRVRVEWRREPEGSRTVPSRDESRVAAVARVRPEENAR